jgi:hypothetical protein
MSEAISSVVMLRDGAGDMRLRAYLRPADPLLGVNHYVHASLWAGSEFVGLAFTNFDDAVSTLYTPPWNQGYLMTAHWEHLTPSFSLQDVALTHVPVDPADVTSRIVFEIDYDDTTKAVTTGFSLDGGATYQSISTPLGTRFDGSGAQTASLILGADPRSPRMAPPPGACSEGTLNTDRLVVKKLGAPLGDEKASFKMSFSPHGDVDSPNEGLTVYFVEPGSSSPFLTVSAPPAAAGTCGPHDGWRTRTKGAFTYYEYRNQSGAVPPCAPGSAGGLRALKVRQLGFDNVWVQATLRGASIDMPPANAVATALVRPNNVPAGQCAGADGTFSCPTMGSGRRCR